MGVILVAIAAVGVRGPKSYLTALLTLPGADAPVLAHPLAAARMPTLLLKIGALKSKRTLSVVLAAVVLLTLEYHVPLRHVVRLLVVAIRLYKVRRI